MKELKSGWILFKDLDEYADYIKENCYPKDKEEK